MSNLYELHTEWRQFNKSTKNHKDDKADKRTMMRHLHRQADFLLKYANRSLVNCYKPISSSEEDLLVRVLDGAIAQHIASDFSGATLEESSIRVVIDNNSHIKFEIVPYTLEMPAVLKADDLEGEEF